MLMDQVNICVCALCLSVSHSLSLHLPLFVLLMFLFYFCLSLSASFLWPFCPSVSCFVEFLLYTCFLFFLLDKLVLLTPRRKKILLPVVAHRLSGYVCVWVTQGSLNLWMDLCVTYAWAHTHTYIHTLVHINGLSISHFSLKIDSLSSASSKVIAMTAGTMLPW